MQTSLIRKLAQDRKKRTPIDIVRPYHERDPELCGHPKRKRKSGNTLDSPSKKLRQVTSCENMSYDLRLMIDSFNSDFFI